MPRQRNQILLCTTLESATFHSYSRALPGSTRARTSQASGRVTPSTAWKSSKRSSTVVVTARIGCRALVDGRRRKAVGGQDVMKRRGVEEQEHRQIAGVVALLWRIAERVQLAVGHFLDAFALELYA